MMRFFRRQHQQQVAMYQARNHTYVDPVDGIEYVEPAKVSPTPPPPPAYTIAGSLWYHRYSGDTVFKVLEYDQARRRCMVEWKSKYRAELMSTWVPSCEFEDGTFTEFKMENV